MSCSYDQDDQFIVPDFVQHPMIADAQPPQAAQIALEDTAKKRIVRQSVDCGDDSGPFGFGDAPKFPDRAALNPN